MNTNQALQVLVFLGVMILATVLPAAFILGGVVLMRTWMSPKRRRAAANPEVDPPTDAGPSKD